MLKEAYDLLEIEYKKCLSSVHNNKDLKAYAEEKHRHSMQVMGAGNYLIKRIEWLSNKSADFIELVKTAVFLHDICRFREITLLFQGSKNFDHGVQGGEFLRTIPLFNDIRIWLPIRHHGHLIESLYEDADYQNIADKILQEEVKQICFIIRDADKIANLHMFASESAQWPLFLGKNTYEPQVDGRISDIIKQNAFKDITVPRLADASVADRIVSLLSWYTDINYQSAIDFCHVLGVTEKMLQIFAEHCIDDDFKAQYSAYITNFIATHQYLK